MRRQVFKISIGQILLIIIVMCAVIWGLSLVNKEDAPEELEVVENISIDNTVASNNFDQTFSTVEENLESTSTKEDEIVFVTSVLDNGDDTYTLSGIKYKKYVLSQSELQYAIDDGELFLNEEPYTLFEVEEDVFELYPENSEICVYNIRLDEDNNYILEANTELSDCWRLSEEVCKVKVGKDIKVVDFNGDKKTVEEVFDNMENKIPEETTHPVSSRTFRFTIKNGKCTKVENVLTSI